MRARDVNQSVMFSYSSPEQRVPATHPLRRIREITDSVLQKLSGVFAKMYSNIGRRSIPPEQLLRTLLLQSLYTIRSERMLMEQLEYNLLFRWFVGLNLDEPVWDVACSARTAHGCCKPMWPNNSSTWWWSKPRLWA